jgi:hypothetical protein
MKPAAPEVLRKGAVIRVAGGSVPGTRALALSYVDLRFADGHVERWIGPGQPGEFPSGDDPGAALVSWGEDVIEINGDDLRSELAMDFSGVPNELAGPVEIVAEWNASLPREAFMTINELRDEFGDNS